MNKIIIIRSGIGDFLREDYFRCPEDCDGCLLRFKCYTEPDTADKTFITLKLEELRELQSKGFKLGENIG